MTKLPYLYTANIRTIETNDGKKLKNQGVKSPDLSKMKQVKINAKTIIFK